MKKKLLVIENIRRAWLLNTTNFFVLLFIFPFYLLTPRVLTSLYFVFFTDPRGYLLVVENLPVFLIAYSLLAVSFGAFLLFRISMAVQRAFMNQIRKSFRKRGNLELIFYVVYGDCIPHLTLFFVPVMITIVLFVDLIDIDVVFRIGMVFVIFFVMIFYFTYQNLRNISRNLTKIKSLLDEENG